MSDVAQGPGWWIASDSKWYPPEQHPEAAAPVADPPDAGTGGRGTQPGRRGASTPLAPLATYAPGPAENEGPSGPSHVKHEFVSGMPGGGVASAEARIPTNLPSFWAGRPPESDEEGGSTKTKLPDGVPPPPPVIIPPVRTPRPPQPGHRGSPQSARQGAAPAADPGGLDLANGPGGSGPNGLAGGVPAGGYGGQHAPLSPYEEGVYAGEALGRRQRKRHFPIWTLLVIVILAVGGFLIYHQVNKATNPHRSAAAVAEDYVTAASQHDMDQLAADVIPGQKPYAGALDAAGGFSYGVAGTTTVGQDKVVNLLACTGLYAGSSCSTQIDGYLTGQVPTREIDHKWYVDAAKLPTCDKNTEQLVCYPVPTAPQPVPG